MNLEQYILPIFDNGASVGQGFVADGYFITAAHIVKDSPSCYIVLNGKRHELSKEEFVFLGEGDIHHDETMVDIAVYSCEEISSPLHLSDYKPHKGDQFDSYCIKENSNPFSLEKLSPQTSSLILNIEQAVVKGNEDGNYFYCQCKRFGGSSGSPLLKGNEVVGIMHGGDDNGLCAFLKAQVLRQILGMENLSTKVTKQDIIDAWRGVNGILYSEDRKRLLAVSEKNISRYKIKEGTKVICDFAFDACRYLEEIAIPDSVIKLGNRAFSGCCVDLNKIVIPDSVIEIGEDAFCGCTNLKSIHLPIHIKKISKKCLAFCDNIDSIIIPDEVQEIEEFSFFCCKKLASITFTSTIRIIGDSIFYGCDNLRAINIPIGSKQHFETLLPDYEDKLIEQENGWRVVSRRTFDIEEIAMIQRAEIVPSIEGRSVCFFMNSGGQTYIPLIDSSPLAVGDAVDFGKVCYLILQQDRRTINKIEAY